MRRMAWCLLAAGFGVSATLPGQAPPPAGPGASLHQGAVHYGKWLTAGAAVAFTVLAAHEHRYSRHNWDDLLVICRSADDACARGNDGRYLNSNAEFLYQRSLYYDRRANRRLVGAQASLLVTAALFIIDLSRRNDEPDNIPFRPLRVTLEPARDGAHVGLSLSF